MPGNSIFMEYIIFPLIIFLIVLLIYQFIKKRIMKDDKDELESLKLLQELLEKGCLLYTSPSPRDPKTSRMPSSA